MAPTGPLKSNRLPKPASRPYTGQGQEKYAKQCIKPPTGPLTGLNGARRSARRQKERPEVRQERRAEKRRLRATGLRGFHIGKRAKQIVKRNRAAAKKAAA